MMNVTYACPACDQTTRSDLTSAPQQTLTCQHCGGQMAVPSGAVTETHVHRCVVCPSVELYVRKDFSQRWGVLLVLVGAVASSISWYLYHIRTTYMILFGFALLDLLFYLFKSDLLQCYRCQAQYRGVAAMEDHQHFQLETHERHRQQAARLAAAGSEPAARE